MILSCKLPLFGAKMLVCVYNGDAGIYKGTD